MKTKLTLIIVGIIIFFFSCEKETIIYPRNIEFNEIIKGDLTSANEGNSNAHCIIFNTQNSWNTFTSQLYFDIEDSIKLIDFNQFSVLAIFDKEQFSSPASIHITNIIDTKDTLFIHTETQCCGSMDALTYPFQVVKTEKINQKVFVIY